MALGDRVDARAQLRSGGGPRSAPATPRFDRRAPRSVKRTPSEHDLMAHTAARTAPVLDIEVYSAMLLARPNGHQFRAAYGHSAAGPARVAPRGAESEIPTWGMAKKAESRARRHVPPAPPPPPPPPPQRKPPSAYRNMPRKGGALFGYYRPLRSRSRSPPTTPLPARPPVPPASAAPEPAPPPPKPSRPPLSPAPPRTSQPPPPQSDEATPEEHRRRAKLAFDKRHHDYLLHAEQLVHHLGRARERSRRLPTEFQDAWQRGLQAVYRNRFFCPEDCLPEPPPWRSEEHPWDNFVSSEKVVWRLEDAELWKPRVQPFIDPSSVGAKKLVWSQSGSYYDTAEHLAKCLDCDWKYALEKGMEKLIEKTDKSDRNATAVEDCRLILHERVGLIYSIFDYYAHMTSTDDIFHMHLNAYKSLIEDCKLSDQSVKHISLTRYDQLFVALGAHSEVARALGRPDWLLCLVHFAIMRRILTEETESVAEALVKLLDVDLRPNVDRRALHDANEFRRRNCYTQGVTQDGLSDWAPHLKKMFDELTRGDGAIGDVLHSKFLLEFPEWKMLLKELKILGEDVTPREVAMSFIWSRLRVVDVRQIDSQVRETQLHFTDFLEAVCRLATMKRLPTDEQIFEFGYEDAGEFCLKLKDASPSDWQDFLEASERPFDDHAPLPQPNFRLVDHMCCVLVKAFDQAVRLQAPNPHSRRVLSLISQLALLTGCVHFRSLRRSSPRRGQKRAKTGTDQALYAMIAHSRRAHPRPTATHRFSKKTFPNMAFFSATQQHVSPTCLCRIHFVP